MAKLQPGRTIRLWDLPVRLVHWSFVALLPAMWWTAETGALSWHLILGEVFVALLGFRLLWGVFGSEPARFAHFVKGPLKIIAHLQGKAPPPAPGHNPLGGWSVIAMLALLGLQIGLGLIAQDVDGLEAGPLAHLVSYETSDLARHWHHLVFNGIISLVALHVGAIAYYLVRKGDNLVGPMITGSKSVPYDAEQPRRAGLFTAVLCVVSSFAFAWWISLGAPMP